MTATPDAADDARMRTGRTASIVLTAVGVVAVWVLAVADPSEHPWWQLPTIVAVAAVPVVLGLVLSARRPRLAIGPLLVALSVVPLIEFAVATWGMTDHRGAHTAAVLDAGGWMWFLAPAALLVAVFPDGRLPSRRWSWLITGWPVVLVLFHLGVALDPNTYRAGGGRVPGSPPTWIPAALAPILGLPALAGLLALLIGSAAAVALRYRRGDTTLRRQIRWLAMSAMLLPAVLVLAWLSFLLSFDGDAAVTAGLLAVFVALPAGTVIGILRHDLYDIDRLVSRTVTYTLVTAALTVVFAAVVLGAGLLIGRNSTPVVALATLICAVVFGRLRKAVQERIDRRFDRERDRAIRAIRRFVDDVRDDVAAPEDVDTALRQALGDDEVRVAYRRPGVDGTPRWFDGSGAPVAEPTTPCRPLLSGGLVVAVVMLGPVSTARPGLVGDVLREAHFTLEVVRARGEIQAALAETEASRTRLVQAGYEERRRLERDLHDGAQQRLVALGMSLRLAQRRLPPGSDGRVFDEAVVGVREALSELRRVSQGVRPSGLDDGLAAALRSLARTSPVPVELRIGSDRIPDPVATTAYYVVAEAVANALKHADASAVCVDVGAESGVLHVAVTDDGRGGARVVPGSGLAGLVDRVSASGGTLLVRGAPGAGTTVEARLPC
jgi:signal transduction histidine kinase